MVIKNNESIVPFFGERLGFIRGLDPLGLQNTSEAAFTLLLPGLNNVTGRIRYYSFYCWLLDEYSKQIGDTNPLEQQKFIRKAEYIIALTTQFTEEDATSIPGSNYATNEVRQNETGEYDLNAGTYKPDGATRNTYWNWYAGAFGQYYLGSLYDIGIIAQREGNSNIYVRTSNDEGGVISGETLAKAFDANIEPNHKTIFFRSIEAGRITEEQVSTILESFDLTRVPGNTDEQKLLIQLLLQKDFPLRIEEEPLTFRKQTLNLLMQHLEATDGTDQLNGRAFVIACYNSKGRRNDGENECVAGWYYYQLNEFWQYASTAILNGVLAHLEKKAGPNFVPLTDLVTEITESTVRELIRMKLLTSSEALIGKLVVKIEHTSEFEFFDEIGNGVPVSDIANSVLLILKLYSQNNQRLEYLKQYATRYQIERDGDPITFFLRFESSKESPVSQFLIDFLHRKIINRHQFVALRKIGGGSFSTQKFIIEDLRIRYIGNFGPGFTGPRIGTLLSFLRDLGILSSEDKVTRAGKGILNSLAE